VIDVLVVGAGPAGLATALHAAAAGLQTTVLDSHEGPIDKACGEGLMPGALRRLRELGVQVSGQPIRGISYRRAQYRAEAEFRLGPGAGVRRTELHSALRARAIELGVPICKAKVGPISQDGSSVTAAGMRARYLVAADGLHSPIRRQLRLDRPAPGQLRRWGLRQHFDVEPWSDFVEVHWARDSELYVTPVSPSRVGIAILSSRRQSFREALADFAEVAQRLPASGVNTIRGAGPLRQASKSRVAGRVLLIGDAAGYVDALTGEGIAVSLACAQPLVKALLANRPADYERDWRSASRRYRVLTESLLWARQRRMLNTALVPASQRAPWLFAAIVNQLAR
jgi:flavin-dependent dehydrogenase